MEQAARYQRYRAPQEDGQTLVDPPRSSLADVVDRNRREMATVRCDVQGRDLADLATAARRGLVRRAVAYTREYGHVPSDLPAVDAPLVLSGHQPQLYHPGVWYKNFLLGWLAKEMRGTGVHLLIDSDLCRTVSIRVPAGTVDHPHVEHVEYDLPDVEVPYEERSVHDEATFASFPQRVAAALDGLIKGPLVEALWPLTRDSDGEPRQLGRRLARARHQQEQAWGNATLELPQSAVCGLPEFAWFMAHVLAHLPRFWSAHNESLADYRHAHRLRNRAHPVPDLTERDGWLEAPFWIWSSTKPRRRRLFARQRGEELLITDRHEETHALKLSADQDAGPAVEQLLSLSDQGLKIRTRALATTMFARLLLGDLFIHGIGGAKYDQVTDQIAQRFFGFSLPRFATVSATLRLPVQHARAEETHQRELRQQLRELQYHPEKFVNASAMDHEPASAGELIARKRRWISTPQTPDNARRRHQEIVAVNGELQPYVAELRSQLATELASTENRARADAILEAREYSFCLFPPERLQRLLLNGGPNHS